MLKWYEQVESNNDIVISSRVRLARNLYKYPFSSIIGEDDAKKLVKEVINLADVIAEEDDKSYYWANVDLLSDMDKIAMLERHILSPNLVAKKQSTGVILSEDESISIMINEEDHVRIQSIMAGLDLIKAYEKASEIDDITNKHLKYAFDDKFGYLTSCPTNVGTGMRASCMMFLPALTSAKLIPKLMEELAKFGVTIRGTYGEGTKSLGNIYQISNQKTLGVTEIETIDSLNRLIAQVTRHENKRREYMLSVNQDELEDQVHRVYGILKYSKQLNSEEAMSFLAQLKFGIDYKLIKLNDTINTHQLMMEIQPGTLQWKLGKAVGSSTRNKIRAEYIKKHLPEII